MGNSKREREDTLKVLHIIVSLAPEQGGPAVSVPGLTQALAEAGIHCEIFTTNWNGVGDDAMLPSVVPIHRFEVGFAARFWPAYSKGLGKVLKKKMGNGAFDLVHVHEPWHYLGFIAFRVARKNAIPYVLSPRGALEEWCLRQKAFKKQIYRMMIQDRILKFADAIHALTNEEMTSISKLGYKSSIFVAPNGIDPSPFECPPDTSAFLAAYPELVGKRVILYLGRLHPKKGLDVLARSYVSLSHKFENTALLVAGLNEDGTQERMESILKTSPASGSTVFTGLLTGKDKLAALACADLFVLPSHSEGFSMAILEALAAGLPVVISKQCNFPEVSEHDAGLVIEPNDAAVTEAISTLLSDDQLRTRMGQNGRNLVREKYTWDAIAASMAGLYQRLVARRSAKRKFV